MNDLVQMMKRNGASFAVPVGSLRLRVAPMVLSGVVVLAISWVLKSGALASAMALSLDLDRVLVL